MKKFLLLSLCAVLFSAFSAQKAEAQQYPYRVMNTCSVCHQAVYAVYRPVNYNGCIQYAWVPVYHTQCQARPTYSTRTITRYQGIPYNYVTPARPVYRHGYSNGYSTRYRSSCSSSTILRRPGFSITIRR